METDWSEKLKALLMFLIALAFVVFLLATCTVNNEKQKTERVTACLEKTEDAVGCFLFEEESVYNRSIILEEER